MATLRHRQADARDETPSPEEQETAEWYCCKRPLERTSTGFPDARSAVLLFLAVNCVVAVTLGLLLDRLGVFSRWEGFVGLPVGWARWLTLAGSWLAVNALGLLICLRSALIGMVRLYQYYAPEEIRRRCICMPTCSEYTILALRKHGVIVGLLKSFDRVYYRCRGNVYRIDYP